MFDRFRSEASLVEALRQQVAVGNDRQLAERLAKVAKVEAHPAGARIIEEGRADREIYFVLAGRVAIEIKGQQVATRGPGQHFGEMALIDLGARRSATVRALEDTVTARVSEPHFTAVAGQHQGLWRSLALELSKRLRERAAPGRLSNERPEIFIGSSGERPEIARALQAECARQEWSTRTWSAGVAWNGAGGDEEEERDDDAPAGSLAAMLDRLDFGLLVVAADGLAGARGASLWTPRDNVLFELGLLYATLGRERTFLVRVQDEPALRLPPDLLGLATLDIPGGRRDDLPARVAPAIARLREVVRKLGPR